MNTGPIIVPTLEELRGMSNAELLKLRTELTWASTSVDEQLNLVRTDDESDDDWERRARGARLAFQRGMSAIKNIMQERGAANRDARDIPLAPWLAKLMEVYQAAEILLDAEDQGDIPAQVWENLEDAIEAIAKFMVSHEFGVGATL